MSSSTGTDRPAQQATGPTLYVANFDFDDRLAKPSMTTLPKTLRAINARLAPLLEPLCGPGDAVVLPGEWVPDADRFGRVEPWGVEPHVLGWLGLIGVRDSVLRNLPDPAAVRAVNSRRWQYFSERSHRSVPHDLVMIEPETGPLWFDPPMELGAVLRRMCSTGGCVAKSEFGGSGRGVRIALDEDSLAAVSMWGKRLLERGRRAFFEPYDDADAEISAHLTVTEDGITFDGLCTLRSSARGQFESVEPLLDAPAAWLESLPIWTTVAKRARADGYRGYLGIDAAVKGSVVIRPVRDVNARWTMGRVALATGKRVSNP